VCQRTRVRASLRLCACVCVCGRVSVAVQGAQGLSEDVGGRGRVCLMRGADGAHRAHACSPATMPSAAVNANKGASMKGTRLLSGTVLKRVCAGDVNSRHDD
jgi:hypothetical protein